MTLRIYIAGPIGNTARAHNNVLDAIHAAQKVKERGLYPFVPHLAWYWNAMHPASHTEWMAWCLAWLPVCDAVLRLPGVSPGATVEVREAKRLGLPVFEGIDDLTEWAKS